MVRHGLARLQDGPTGRSPGASKRQDPSPAVNWEAIPAPATGVVTSTGRDAPRPLRVIAAGPSARRVRLRARNPRKLGARATRDSRRANRGASMFVDACLN